VTEGPVAAFDAWFGEARAAGIPLAEAMTLATATPDGAPSARVVLMKGHDAAGFVWFTDRRSRKGAELAANPRAALVFDWRALGRQVRAEGAVEQIGDDATWAYYRTRPRGSRIGAWASHQSAVIASRADLEAQVAAVEERFAGGDPPLPPHWTGYRLTPDVYEFWTHDDARLHDRVVYRRAADGWARQLLSP
jgi:pyridoxamine 5'-phosphate oxidase